MNNTENIRWKQRFQNFEKAFLLLKEIVESKDNLSDYEAIVQEGIVQRFEYTFELTWKTLKDKMEFDGISFERISPKYVFKDAYKSKYIDDIDVWIEMTNSRNLMSHTYDSLKLSEILKNIKEVFYPEMLKMYNYFKDEIQQGVLKSVSFMKFGLTETQEKILIGILKKYIKSGEVVVFGSRAMGTNTARSDIDIALKNVEFFLPYSLGDLIDEIAESDFPYLADVLIYEEVTNPALKEHIDGVGERLVEVKKMQRYIEGFYFLQDVD